VEGNLHRYWIELADGGVSSLTRFGVTAFDEADAIGILSYVVFDGQPLPDVLEIRADVDVRDLDQGRVVPNMSPPSWRGIWYPKGFDTDIR